MAVVCIAVLVGIVLGVFRYFRFVSKTVYEESVSHLTEVFHQSDNMLRELTDKNLTYLHIWGENLQDILSEDEIRDYIKKAQEDTGFLEFFFLSADGDYKMATGETGYLGLQENMEEEIRQGNDVIANAAVPGKSQLLIFATPKAHGIYQGFEYDAIAIAYENSDIVDVLDISAFDGNAQSFMIHPDGRVVVDHSSEAWGNVYNFFGILREHSDMSEKEINALLEKFKAGRTDAMLLNLDGRNYYLVYEKADIQDWMFLGLVQADIVNASMNRLQRSTIFFVSAIVFCIAALFISLIIQKNRINLRRKDTEILYRDELFQKLSMNVDDVFLMLDAKTYQADYVSPNVEKLLGITVEQIHKDICILGKLHSEKQEDPEKNYLEEIQVQEQREWDFEYVHLKTGEKRWFHNIAMGSEVNGKKKYILVMSDRTSDRKMNQALSEAVRAAETANKAKSTFLSNMSHDIRTPMNAIIGFTTLAVSNIDDKKRVRDYLGKILSSSNHLLSLINDILDMSRIESGKIHLEETEVSLSDVLHDLKTIISGQIHAKQLELYMDAMDVTNEDVYCDKTRLNQVLLNLLSNAVKFTDEGSITMTARYEERRLVVAIADTGKGMEPADRERIFQEFTRLPGAQGKEGFGLGLSIVRMLVQLLEGTIDVDSVPGKGSTFTLRVPLFPVQVSEDTGEKYQETETGISSALSESMPASSQPSLRVLLIDDDRIQLTLTAAMLQHSGIASVSCMQLDELLDALRSDTFDVLLTDVQMPAINGFDLLKLLRASNLPQAQAIPVIAVTARSDMKPEEFKEYGFAGCLHKPFTVAELFRELNAEGIGQTSAVRSEVAAAETVEASSPDVPYDFSALTAFSGDDPEAAKSIMESFVTETRLNAERLQKAADAADMDEVAAVSHKMIPLFTLIGATELVAELKILEGLRGTPFTAGQRQRALRSLALIEDIIRLQTRAD